eukprot:jgi/Orpsp1_1/1185202/evm.model.c7180000092761.1
MKTLTLYTLILSVLLLCYAYPGLSSSSLSSNREQEKLDDERDQRNYLAYENIERDIDFNNGRLLDVYYDKKNTSELKPVYLFIFGGSWYSGDKVKFTKFGQLFETNGYVAVLPNYILFPRGGFEDMVDDIYKAIKWTIDNIEKYGGDPTKISLSAYSAGSHLTTLTLLKSLLEMKNKKATLEPFPEFEKVILLNGPYDFDDFSVVKRLFGTDINNSIIEKLAKLVFRSKNVSPTDILKLYKDDSIDNLGAKKFIFFYTSLDAQVKESSAVNFMAQMKRVCPTVNIEYVYKEGYEHTTLTRGVRAGQQEQEDVFMSLVNL